MRALRSSFAGFAIAAALVAAPAITQAQPVEENIQMRFPGAAAGEWSGKGKFVPGPPDGSCSNMGAVDKVNTTFLYGFAIPDDGIITGVTAFIKAGAQDGQVVGVQLAEDSDTDTPSFLGSEVDLAVIDAPTGSCSETDISEVNGTLANWGNPVLSPAVVNADDFGLIFTKRNKSEIKVDAVCLQIHYTSEEGEAIQERCFEDPPSSITVIKEVVGEVPGSDWEFEFDGQPFTLPADGGVQVFTPLEPADYDIEEAMKDGWTASVSCTDGTAVEGDFVTVELGESENITCTFVNEADPATITVVKELAEGSPDPDEDWGFSFNDDDFFLDAGEQRVFGGLASGTYNIVEDVTLGFRVAASCTDGTSGGGSVNVTVEPGEEVTCVFTNRRIRRVPAVGLIGLGVLALMLAGLARRRMR